MELGQLRTFKVVATTLHFTRASELLNLSQPAVSHQIKSLEKELNERLFVRGKQGIALTDAGRILLDHATEILEISDRMTKEIKGSIRSASGSITLGCPNRALENPFLTFYEGFSSENEGINLIYRNEPGSAEVFEGVESDKIDVGVVLVKPDRQLFEAMPYGTFEMQFVVGPNHWLARRTSVDAASVRNEKWAVFEEGDELRVFTEASLASARISPGTRYVTNDGSVIRDLVTTNRFVALLPSRGISKDLENGTIINVSAPELESTHEAYLIWKRGKSSPSINALVNFVLEHELPGISLTGLKLSATP